MAPPLKKTPVGETQPSDNPFDNAIAEHFRDAGVPDDEVDAGMDAYKKAGDAGVESKPTPSVATPDSEDPVIKKTRALLAGEVPPEVRPLDPDKPKEGGYADWLTGAKHTLGGGTYTLGLNDAITSGMNTTAHALSNALGVKIPYADHTIDGKEPTYAGATPSHTVREKPVEEARERHPEHTAAGEGQALMALTYGAGKFLPAVAKYVGAPATKGPRFVDGVIPPEPGRYTRAYRGAVKTGKQYVADAAEALPKTTAAAKGVGRSAAGLGAAAVARGGQLEGDRASQVIDEFKEHPYQTALTAAAPVVLGSAAGAGLNEAGKYFKDKANVKVAAAVADGPLVKKLERQGGSEAYKKLGKQIRDMGLLETSLDSDDHSWKRTTAARVSNNVQRQKEARGAEVARASDKLFNSSTGRRRKLPDGRMVPETVGDVALPTQSIRNQVEKAARGQEYANTPASEVREIRRHLNRLTPRQPEAQTVNRAPLLPNSLPLDPMDASVRAGVVGQPPPPPPPQTRPAIKLDLPSTGVTTPLGGPARGNAKYRGSTYKGQPPAAPAAGAYPEREPPDVLPPATEPETPAGHMPLGGTGVGSPGGPQRNAPKPTEPVHAGLRPEVAPAEVPGAVVPHDAALRQWEQEQELGHWNLGEQPPKHLGTQPQPYVAPVPRFNRQTRAREPSSIPNAAAPLAPGERRSPTAKPEPRPAGAKPTYTSKLKADPSKTKSSVRNYGKPKKPAPEPNLEEEIKDFQLEKPQLLGPANPPEWPQVVEPNQMKLDRPKLELGGPAFQEMAPTAPRINLSPHEQRNEAKPPRLNFATPPPTVGIPQPMQLTPPFQAPLGVGQAQPQNRNVPFQAPSLLRPPTPEVLPHNTTPDPQPRPRINLMPTEQRTGPRLDVSRLQLKPPPGFASMQAPIVTPGGPAPQLKLTQPSLRAPGVALNPAPQPALRTSANLPVQAPTELPFKPDPSLSGGYSSMYQPKSNALVPPLSLLPENRQLPNSTGVARAPTASPVPGPEHFTLRQGNKVQQKLMDDLTSHVKQPNKRVRPGEDEGKRPIAYGLNREKLNLLESMKGEGRLIPEIYKEYRDANRAHSTLKDIENSAATKAGSERRGGNSMTNSVLHRLFGEQRSLHRYGSIADSIGNAIKSPAGAMGISAGVSGYRGSKQSGSDYRDANEQMKKELEEDLNGTNK